MEFQRATYSYSALKECADLVKSINTTVATKKEHFSKCFEVKKAYDFCLEKTNCCLFEADHNQWKIYIKAVDIKDTKKNLDMCLIYCLNELKHEINGIAQCMANGEVDCVA